ncbi:MAG: transcriptional regulator [Acidimicrobiales bacterium]
MAPRSDPRLLVLHGLRLKGMADATAIAESAGLTTVDVEACLERLAADGLVVQRGEPLARWSLTPAGRSEHSRLAGREIDAAGARPSVEGAYERFRGLNTGVLDACSRWQVRDIAGTAVRNDHRDPGYDARVVADLAALHRRAEPLCDGLAAALERFRPYGHRLSRAVEKIEAGEGDWFTKPLMPSYHTVWFELHEDLLTTLGLDRTREAETRPAAAKGAS